MRAFAVTLATCAVLSAGRFSARVGEDPVMKVVTLMEDMVTKIKLDGETDQKTYDKFACWCEESTQRKATSITEAKSSIESLTNRILELKGSIASNKANIADLNNQVNGNYAGQQSAKKIREKQQSEYLKKRSDLEQAIGALEGAIKTLEAGTASALQEAELLTVGGELKKALRYSEDNHKITGDNRQVIEQFLSDPASLNTQRLPKFSGIQEKGHFGDYAPGSGAIQGILKGMYDQMTSDLEKANVEEAQWQKQYEGIYELKGEEEAALKKTLAAKEQSLADDEKELSDKTQERDETQTSMVDDEKFFMSTKQQCKERAADWAERTRMRTEELAGVNKAIEILTSDDAKETFGRATSMLLQAAVVHRHNEDSTALPARRAYEAIARVAKKRRSIRLSALAAQVQTATGGHFKLVIASVQAMLQALREEENDDIKLKAMCKLEEDKAAGEVEDLEHKMTNQQGAIDRLKAKKQQLEDDRDEATQDVKDTEEALAEALATREKENEAYRAAAKDDVDAVGLLTSALEAMTAFYRDNKLPLELVAKAETTAKKPEYSDDAPPENSSFGKKSKGQGGGIISILKYLKEDLENEIITTRNAEARAQAAFTEIRSKGQSSIGALNAKIVTLGVQIGEADEAITDLEGEKKAADDLQTGKEDYIEALKPKCEWIKNDFESRREARNEEMDGLQEAKILLAGKTSLAQTSALRGGSSQ